jgi:protein involved in polysaccharide export with SLBB domain
MHRILPFVLAVVLPAQVFAQMATVPASSRVAASRPQPGDQIAVHVIGEPNLSDTMMINERGDAPFARLGVIHVTDMSIAALEDTLRARYSKMLRTPAIELSVLRRISVEGQVYRPNVYFIDLATTLREVIVRAGGMTESANRNAVSIIRDGVRTPVPNWQSDESVASDLRSGDQVVVGRKSWLALNLIGAISAAGVITSIVLALTR